MNMLEFNNENVWSIQQLLDTVISKYHKKYMEWSYKYNDDRELFCNTYEIISSALLALKDVRHHYVILAINKALQEDFKLMDEILNHNSSKPNNHKEV